MKTANVEHLENNFLLQCISACIIITISMVMLTSQCAVLIGVVNVNF